MSGGGGGPGPTARKQAGQRLFFEPSTYFTVYRGGPIVLLQRKLYFSKDPEGVQHFPGGSNFLPGAQMLISIETHITCDLPWGPDPLSSSLNPHLAMLGVIDIGAYAMSTD